MDQKLFERFFSLRRKIQSSSLLRLNAVNRDGHIISALWKNRFSTLATKFKNNEMTKFFSFSKISTPTNQNLEFIILNSTMVTTRRKILSQILQRKSFASIELFQTTFTHAYSDSQTVKWKSYIIQMNAFTLCKMISGLPKLPSILANWPLFRSKNMFSLNWAFC